MADELEVMLKQYFYHDGNTKYQQVKRKRNLAVVNVHSKFTRNLVLNEFRKRSENWELISRSSYNKLTNLEKYQVILEFVEYEKINWDHVMVGKSIANSYCIRRGLIRKGQFTNLINKSRNREKLNKFIPESMVLSTWEIFETSSLQQFGVFDKNLIINECLYDAKLFIEESKQDLFILKPSIGSHGAEICLVKNIDEVKNFVLKWPDCREWVLQLYVMNPLLKLNQKKFHVRVYILAVDCIKVYVYKKSLALFASEKYSLEDYNNNYSHITNTSYQNQQVEVKEEDIVYLLNEIGIENVEEIYKQIYESVDLLFSAIHNQVGIFQPIKDCFEVYGLDYIIDQDLNCHLLEVNASPDFKQTGNRLQSIIEQFFSGVFELAVDPLANENKQLSSFTKENFHLAHSSLWNFRDERMNIF